MKDYITRKKSAFRFPNDPNAVFHQQPAPVFTDRRSNYVNPEFLIREQGMKDRNIKKMEYEQKLLKARNGETTLEDVEMDNENKIINLNTINNDMYMDDVDVSVKKKHKSQKIDKKVNNSNAGDMDIDTNKNEGLKPRKYNTKKKKKNKSYYIANYV